MTVVITEPPISHADAAQQRIQELRRWRDLIPHFVMPTSQDETRRLSQAASVSAEFIELTNVVVTNQPSVARHESPTPAEVRDLMGYADAYDPLADELEAFAHFVRHSVTSARNLAGSEALTRYAIAQRLARQRKTAHLAPYVTDMRRALGRARKAAKTPETPPAAEPVK